LQCIDCQACAGFAPDTFKRHEKHGYHVVHSQPQTLSEIARAQAALRACPVAAIRLETLAERRHGADDVEAIQAEWELGGNAELVAKMSDRNVDSFPRPFLKDGEAFSVASSATEPFKDVYWTGHHNEASFGAIPYLVKGNYRPKTSEEATESVWVMVDSPKFSKTAVQDVTRVAPNGPHFLLMTHVDDTADHEKWAQHFPNMKQIFHEGDLGRYNWVGDKSLEHVEILLRNEHDAVEPIPGPEDGMLDAYSLDGSRVHVSEWLLDEKGDDMDLLILHTPGHSYGSISLYRRDGIVFTGDTYAATQVPGSDQLQMTGFGRYGRDSSMQCSTLEKLLKLPYRAIAPGHGLSKDYRSDPSQREPELRQAQDRLRQFR
jgi:ferredoxin